MTTTVTDGASGFPPTLRGILFAVFDAERGPFILQRVPEVTAGEKDLVVNFDSIIPKASACGKISTSTLHDGQKLLGLPVRIESDAYERNAFIFNLLFLFNDQEDTSCYDMIARKCARILTIVETETHMISRDVSSGGHLIKSILTQMLDDLNTFRECSIAVNETTSLSLKLFPTRKAPVRVKPWDVPICTVDLGLLQERNWDITLLRIIPFLNGVTSLAGIAKLADVDLVLCLAVVEHLVYYDCVVILDLFQYTNSYTVLANIHRVMKHPELQVECLAYIAKPECQRPSWESVLQMYLKLTTPTSVSDWIVQEQIDEMVVDVRRMITFGVIMKFLKRVRKTVALVTANRRSTTSPRSVTTENDYTAEINRLVDFSHPNSFSEPQTAASVHEEESVGPDLKSRLLERIGKQPVETDELGFEFALPLCGIEALLEGEGNIKYEWAAID